MMSKRSKSPKSSSSKESMKQATFVRRLVMRNPNVTLEEVQSAWDKAGYPRAGRPKNLRPIYMARTLLRKKYGLKNFEDIPRKKSGEVNITGLLRLLRRQKPGITEKVCRALLAKDGIEFSPALWSVMLSTETKKNRSVEKTESAKTVKVKRARKVFDIKPTKSSSSELMDLENRLDDLIAHARSINEGEMVQFLKNARRHVAQSILNAAH